MEMIKKSSSQELLR